ncbi:hypothetical protein B0H66DRAFT_314961 [Apodospora peruviana]|uniref:Uncharacterized protein n=1 Tax=Apodospora peruviana TaxID=516989 RepID=A0AAE0HZ23_9PEZI|nr:hypothetical protein B0H66DRAFT_314961 [Apodospora peruviana]
MMRVKSYRYDVNITPPSIKPQARRHRPQPPACFAWGCLGQTRLAWPRWVPGCGSRRTRRHKRQGLAGVRGLVVGTALVLTMCLANIGRYPQSLPFNLQFTGLGLLMSHCCRWQTPTNIGEPQHVTQIASSLLTVASFGTSRLGRPPVQSQ